MSDTRQIYRHTHRQFYTFDSYDNGKIITRPAARIPLVRWPNGHWCIEANLFVEKMLLDGLSLKGKGGTISTYISYVCGFLRYMSENSLAFDSLTDEQFSKYITSLYQENRLKNGNVFRVRNRTTVKTMATTLLDFLDFVGLYYNKSHYVSEHGQIRAIKEQRKIRTTGGRGINRAVWCHHSIGVEDPKNKRMPLGVEAFNRLKAAASKSDNGFIRMRRSVMLSLINETGMRRMESVILTVGDVQNAILAMYDDLDGDSNTNHPTIRALGPHLIEFSTVKHKIVSRRQTPIDAVTLQFYESYLRKRKSRMRQLGLDASNPKGPFLISYSTGEALEANTITQEFLELSRIANLEVPCSPHLLRHLYIVRLFKRFLIAHQIENQDHFRRALIDTIGFKEKVRELTGHASVESLEPYLGLALDELSNITSTMSNVQHQQLLDSLAFTSQTLNSEVKNGLNAEFAFKKLTDYINSALTASKNIKKTLAD